MLAQRIRGLGLALGVVFMGASCTLKQSFEQLPSYANFTPTRALVKTKPALAVRGVNCMLCHGTVKSNILTDFGYDPAAPDPRFFENEPDGNFNIAGKRGFDRPFYGNYYQTWQQVKEIVGTVYVPKVTLSATGLLASLGLSAPTRLLDLLTDTTYPDGRGFQPGNPEHWEPGPALNKVVPPAGQPRGKELSRIWIAAPTAEQILGKSATLAGVTLGWEAHRDSILSGLDFDSGSAANARYVVNRGPLRCVGDILVKGPLLLDSPVIDTTEAGCRIYATGTIFLQGELKYSGQGSLQNLQLSSARAVIMGIASGALADRLDSWFTDERYPLTRGPGTNTAKVQAILADGAAVGGALKDATDEAACTTGMITYTAVNGKDSAPETHRVCGVGYSHLVVNAPNVQSRYAVRFKGVVIAEIALFATGALDFEYDPVFDQVGALPLFGEELIDIDE